MSQTLEAKAWDKFSPLLLTGVEQFNLLKPMFLSVILRLTLKNKLLGVPGWLVG